MADSGKIVTFNVVQSTEISSSNAMEKEAFERCLSEVKEQVPVKRKTTDRHVSIASTMKKKHPHIDHQYDVWHLSKSVTKKLTKKAKLKGNDDLTHWIKSISNHLSWCSASCNKNADELVEKWKSVLNHISNQPRKPGSLPPLYSLYTAYAAAKTLVQAGHVTPQNLGGIELAPLLSPTEG